MTLSRIDHPNGFRAWILGTRWFQARLHHWPALRRDPDIHEERASFVSLVLWGQLRETRWREVPGDRYSVTHCRSLESAPTTRRVGLAQDAAFVRRSGTMYHIGRGVLHRVVADAGTWTFSVRGPSVLPFARVYRINDEGAAPTRR
jgi:hypothetical protein